MNPSIPTILCVDDEPRILSALRRSFRSEPYRVLTASEPRAALVWMEEEEVSVLITDQRMPEMVGMELLEAARRRRPGAVCILLTGYPESVRAGDLERYGYCHLMTKPWDDEEIRRTVSRLLHEQRQDEDHCGILRRRPAWRRRGASENRNLAELLVRIDCRVADVADLPLLAQQAQMERRGLVAILDHLPLLTWPVGEFLRRLADAGAEREIPLTVVDPSGLARAHSTLPGDSPLAVYGPEPDPRRILVVSESAAGSAEIVELLSAVGHSCDTAASAWEVDLLLERVPVDVVFLDLALPESGGTMAAQRLRDCGREARVVGLAPWEDYWDVEMLARYDIQRVVRRPFAARDMLDVARGESGEEGAIS